MITESPGVTGQHGRLWISSAWFESTGDYMVETLCHECLTEKHSDSDRPVFAGQHAGIKPVRCDECGEFL